MSLPTRQILTLFLLCCPCSETSVLHRQKRGLMKMMMHIMWDPVRLIRYWYAYDVTKEIAKSWRKIIPTMMLLPLNPHLPSTPGIAKYIHPTHGLGSAKYQKSSKQVVYPESTSGETYSNGQLTNDYLQSLTEHSDHLKITHSDFAAGNSYKIPHKQVVSESSNLESAPVMYPQYFNSQNQNGGHSQNVPFTSFTDISEEFDGPNGAHHVLLQPVHHEFVNSVDHEHLPTRQAANGGGNIFAVDHTALKRIPFPIKISIPNGIAKHVILRAVPMGEDTDGRDHAASSSSNVDSTRNMPFETHPDHLGVHHPSFVYAQRNSKPYITYAGRQDPQQNSNLHQSGQQEVHIVFHPIPISDFKPHSPVVSGGQAMHFLPINFNTNESTNSNSGHFSFFFPTIAHNSESASSHEEHSSSSPEHVQEEFHLKNDDSFDRNSVTLLSKNESQVENEHNNASSSAEVYEAKQTSRVTWVLKQSPKNNRPKDRKQIDNHSYGSIAQITSFGIKGGGRKHEDLEHVTEHTGNSLRLNGQHIDLDQLREDLKHGTPVLIPYDKKVQFVLNSTKHELNDKGIEHLDAHDRFIYDFLNMPKGSVAVDEGRTIEERKFSQGTNYSERHHDGSNSTQKLILFLARKPDFHR